MVAPALKDRYIVYTPEKSLVLSKDGTWIETVFADDALENGELYEFDNARAGKEFVSCLNRVDVPAKLVSVGSIRLGLPPIDSDSDSALNALASSAITCMLAIRKFAEHENEAFHELFEDKFTDILRAEKIIRFWAKHLFGNDED